MYVAVCMFLLWQFVQFRHQGDAFRAIFIARQIADSWDALPKTLPSGLQTLVTCPRLSGRGFGSPKRSLQRVNNLEDANVLVFRLLEAVFRCCFSVRGADFFASTACALSVFPNFSLWSVPRLCMR